MFQKSSIVFFILFFVTTICVAQNSANELKIIWENTKTADTIRFKAFNEYYPEVVFSNPDDVLKVSDIHYALAQKSNSNEEQVSAIKIKGTAYYIKGDFEKSTQSLLRAIAIQSTFKDEITLAKLNTNLGNIYREQNKLLDAVKYYNSSLQIFKENNIESTEADILNNLGLIYFDISYNELALDYFQKALALYQKLNLQDKVGNIWLNIGSVYYENGDFSKAIQYAEKALKILETNNNIFSSADCYLLLAKANQKLNNLDNAFLFAEKSLALNEGIENDLKILDNKIFMAELTLALNQKEATKMGEAILPNLKPTTDKYSKANLYQLLYKCYKAENNLELSHKMYEQYIIYNDSIIAEKNNLALVKEALSQEYKVQLTKTKKEFSTSQETLKRNQIIKTLLLLLSALLIIIFLVVYFNKKSIKNQKKLAELVAEINILKQKNSSNVLDAVVKFELNRIKIENAIDRKINETDWNVLNILLDDPVLSNKDIAEKAFLSVDGIGSALRRMYDYFEIKESKYKKTSLIMKAIKLSNN